MTENEVERSVSEWDQFKGALDRERARAGWSKSQLAKAAGIDRQNLCKMERGKNPRLDSMVRLARALGRRVSIQIF